MYFTYILTLLDKGDIKMIIPNNTIFLDSYIEKEKYIECAITKARECLENGEEYKFEYAEKQEVKISLDNMDACIGFYLSNNHNDSLSQRINGIVSAKNDTEILILSKNLKDWFIQLISEEIANLEWLAQ